MASLVWEGREGKGLLYPCPLEITSEGRCAAKYKSSVKRTQILREVEREGGILLKQGDKLTSIDIPDGIGVGMAQGKRQGPRMTQHLKPRRAQGFTQYRDGREGEDKITHGPLMHDEEPAALQLEQFICPHTASISFPPFR